jgi:transposase-like protein
MGRPSKFPPEVREQAVELVRAIGKTVAEVARDLQMNDTTLGSWVRADRAVPAAEGHPLGLLRLAAPTALGQSGRRRGTDHPDPHRLERYPFRLTVAHLR